MQIHTPFTSFPSNPVRSIFRHALASGLIILLILPIFSARTIAQQSPASEQDKSILLPAKHQHAPDNLSSLTVEGEGFVIYSDGRGGVTCRDATSLERRRLNRGNRNVKLRTMRRELLDEGVDLEAVESGSDDYFFDDNLFSENSTASAGSTSGVSSGSSADSVSSVEASTDGNMKIVLRETDQLINSPQRDAVRAAFIRAAAAWENRIKVPITIVIDVDYGIAWFGQDYSSPNILGQASGGPSPVVRYTNFLQNLTDPTRTANIDELPLYNLLPRTVVPSDIGDIEWMFVSSPLARALGISPPTVDPNPAVTPLGRAPRIGFNSAFSFDFNPDDGIDGDKTDFDAVAVHEIGHALGFTSEVGDANATITLNGVPTEVKLMSVWDLYRMRSGATNATFATAQRIMTPGVDSNDIHAYFAGGTELELSNGGATGSSGDKRQSSHWRDDAYRRSYPNPWIGIMDPNIGRGERRTITDNDLKALDLLGYAITSSAPPPPPPPVQVVPLASGIGQAGTVPNAPAEGQGTLSTTQYAIQVPAGATNLSINLSGNTDVDLFVRQGQKISLSSGIIVSDFRSDGPTGTETINVSGATAPALQAGTYYIAVANYGLSPASFTLTATVTVPQPYQSIVLTPPHRVEMRTWQTNGSTQAYVKMIFPTGGYRVTNNGQVVPSGNSFSVDATVEQSTGAVTQAENSTAVIYDLGALAPGRYSFSFKTSGVAVATKEFDVVSGAKSNLIDDSRQFVRQQYLDFLNREPDAPGWDHWTNEITQCSDAARRRVGESEAQCTDRKRANTSGAFFLALEHQATGYYVYRLYQGALGRQSFRSEWASDAQSVASGIVVNNQLSPEAIDANKQALARQFVERAEFRALYPDSDAATYVARLTATTGIPLAAVEQQALVQGLQNGSETRATVLFKIVDGLRTERRTSDGAVVQVFTNRYGEAFYNREYNRAFVLMQYFGYLQRDADAGGYQFWLEKLNRIGNFVDAEMVRAFIIAPEYRSRFEQP